MTWPIERLREAGRSRGERGFTLLEMVIVLAVLGLVAGMVAFRGPPRSAALDLRAASNDVARMLSEARGRAIASNRQVGVVFDLARRDVTMDGGAPRGLPAGFGLSVVDAAGPVGAPRIGISFAPDGSSSGGRVILAAGERQREIGVDWLTGRVRVTPP